MNCVSREREVMNHEGFTKRSQQSSVDSMPTSFSFLRHMKNMIPNKNLHTHIYTYQKVEKKKKKKRGRRRWTECQ